MTLLKNNLQFPIFGYTLLEDYFIDITISRYFYKLNTKGLEMSKVYFLV